MKRFRKLIAMVLCLTLVGAFFTACTKSGNGSEATPAQEATPTEVLTPTPTEVPATPTPTPNPLDDMTLKDLYADDFKIGIAVQTGSLGSKPVMDEISSQFNSMTLENASKPDALLRMKESKEGLPGTYTDPVVDVDGLASYMKFAKENGIAVRFHTLLWHSQTPAWLFTEDYTVGGAKVSREVMLKRMESYIRQVMTLMEEKYPGQVYCYDVVNEAIDPGHGDPDGLRTASFWYEVVGRDFMNYAFEYARKYAPEGVDLYYNDYNCYMKTKEIINVLKPILEAGNIDGIGMQSHMTASQNVERTIVGPAAEFTAAGFKVQLTELDIGIEKETETNLELQAIKYKVLFKKVREAKQSGKIDLDCITVWGLYDSASWRADEYPLMYKMKAGKLMRKRAWYGAMQDPSIKAIEI